MALIDRLKFFLDRLEAPSQPFIESLEGNFLRFFECRLLHFKAILIAAVVGARTEDDRFLLLLLIFETFAELLDLFRNLIEFGFLLEVVLGALN